MSDSLHHRISTRVPTGTWVQRWVPWVCKHDKVRCIHGDEIIDRGFRRRACTVCGRALKGPLPEVCYFSGRLHYPYPDMSPDGG